MESIKQTKKKGPCRHRFRSKKQKRNDQQARKDTRVASNYSDIVKENADFEKYYKAQKIVQSEEEWQKLMEAFRKSLPSDFRISSNCAGQIEKMRDLIRNKLTDSMVSKEQNIVDNDSLATEFAVSPIPWYPDNLAWTINLSKVEIRKSATLGKLHQFLISETETGDISRQEAVSMIPPLLLNVRPGHSVLDMCAAPGSKTAQIIEMLHQSSKMDFIIDKNDNTMRESEAALNGLVVANDVDNKRCYMLIHQSNRLHSPSVVIINHDASMMPDFYQTNKDNQKLLLKFDRVLADVPCTGDGTVRKNYDVWTKWNTANSNNFHYLQLKIAKRGLELLSKDGLMAYSTCSLNPAEDEAVIATLLNSSQGGLELVDAAATLPLLKCRGGLETWTVMSRDNQVYSSFADVPEHLQTQIRESLFPPANASELNLKYCIRVLPHYQNTGGFFIAILRKKVDKMPWEVLNNNGIEIEEKNGETNSETKMETNEDNQEKKKKKKGFYFGHREDPFFFLTEKDPDWPIIKQFYGFPDSFSCKQLAHRCSTGKRRNIYFLTELAANFISSNPHVKIITGGSRVFNRVDVNNVKCAFRITQEGIPSLFPYFLNKLKYYLPDMNDQALESDRFNIIDFDKEHFVKLMKNEDLKMDEFNAEVRKRVCKLSHGSCILFLRLPRPNPNQSSMFILPICAWKGKNSIRAYVARNERMHILRLCDEEPELAKQEKGVKRCNDDIDVIETTSRGDSIDSLQSEKNKLIDQSS